MAYCREPLFGPKRPFSGHAALSIELAVRPLTGGDTRSARILSVHDDRGKEHFFIGQWKSHLILRIRNRKRADRHSTLEIGADRILAAGAKRLVTVVSAEDGTSLYVDGAKFESSPRVPLLPKGSEQPGYLLLGDAPTGHEGWTGDIFELSFFDRAMPEDEIRGRFTAWKNRGSGNRHSSPDDPVISYRFDRPGSSVVPARADATYGLVLPTTYRVMHKAVLALPGDEFAFTRSFAADAALNILGFVPAGFFFFARFRRSRLSPSLPPAAVSMMLGGLLSLTIELLQAHLPTRDSSITDLALNVVGTTLGVAAFGKAARYLRSPLT